MFDKIKEKTGQTASDSPLKPLLDRLIENPQKAGIALDKTFYLFAETGYAGLLAAVEDRTDLNDLFEQLAARNVCGKPEETDGVTFVKIKNGQVAYSDDAMVILAGTTDKNRISMLFKQDKNSSFKSNPAFETISEQKGDMVMWMSYDLIPPIYRTQFKWFAKGKNIDWKAIQLLYNFHFEKGKLVVDGQTLSTDKNYLELMKQQDAAMHTLEGYFIKMISAQSLIVAMTNISGEYLYDSLMSVTELKNAVEQAGLPVDFKQIASAIQGDVAIGLTALNLQNPVSGLVLYARVNNNTFLSQIDRIIAQIDMSMSPIKVKKEGPTAYVLTIEPMDELMDGVQTYYFGVKDDYFYFTGNRALIQGVTSGRTLADLSIGKQATQYKSLAFVDFVFLNQVAAMFGVNPNLNILDRMEIVSSNANHMKLELILKNKDENFMKQLVQLLINLE